MRLAWATDIHLNFLGSDEVDRFCANLVESGADAVVITGDISEAPALKGHLEQLASRLQRPIYFVLGNHDYYRGSIKKVRAQLSAWTPEHQWLHWLPMAGVVPLGNSTALVGHGGWGDARIGDGARSPIRLNDARMIEELAHLGHVESLPTLARLGEEAASNLKPHLAKAIEHFDNVIVATHVPPFREACWHEGQRSDEDWIPFFSCGAMGEMLRTSFEQAPNKHGTVLCGHTHSSGHAQILPNLEVHTGAAEYGKPGSALVLEV